jgi:alpha-D-ribose 1-methylphosphonate 5-triphosphate synthase subunit PhnG
MNRRRRTRILVDGNPELSEILANEAAESLSIVDVDAPSGGLVMMRMRDTARNDAFFLGEVMVTEAKVRIGGTVGIGMVCGNNTSMARNLAIIDAAYNSGSEIVWKWTERLEAEEKQITERKRLEAAQILKTRVDFSTMETF